MRQPTAAPPGIDLTAIERYVLAKQALTLLLQWASAWTGIEIDDTQPQTLRDEAGRQAARLQAAAEVQQRRMWALRQAVVPDPAGPVAPAGCPE